MTPYRHTAVSKSAPNSLLCTGKVTPAATPQSCRKQWPPQARKNSPNSPAAGAEGVGTRVRSRGISTSPWSIADSRAPPSCRAEKGMSVQSSEKLRMRKRMANSCPERILFMQLLHSEIAGLHAAQADPGENIPHGTGRKGGKGGGDRIAVGFRCAQVQQHHHAHQTDAEQSP